MWKKNGDFWEKKLNGVIHCESEVSETHGIEIESILELHQKTFGRKEVCQMRIISLLAKVDEDLCIGCKTCEFVCPTYAIEVKDKMSKVDASRCTGCWNCENRCPEHCISMIGREPFIARVDPREVDQDKLKALCKKAKLHPKQSVCGCTGTKAEEVAAAILKGAKSVGDIGLMTGASTGCGEICLQNCLRLLEAGGIKYKPHKKGYQNYFKIKTIFEIPEEVFKKYPKYHFEEDKKLLEKMIEIE